MATTEEIATAIRNVGARLKATFVAAGWNTSASMASIIGGYLPPMSVDSFVGYCEIVAKKVHGLTAAQLEIRSYGIWLNNTYKQIDELNFSHINQGQHGVILNAVAMIQMIDAAAPAPVIPPPAPPKVDWEDIKNDKNLVPKDLKSRLRSIALRIEQMEPQAGTLQAKIDDIENAHTAANQLPSDLAELEEQRESLSELMRDTRGLAEQVEKYFKSSESVASDIQVLLVEASKEIDNRKEEADTLIRRSEQALRGSTSVGLSKSFAARNKSLTESGLLWTIGLVLALLAAVLIGWERVSSLKDVLNGDKSAPVILANALLAVLGVGAPVWFAWLATKQIGTTFRLAEDYAFKASVAQAYEGYRAEAVNIDEKLRDRLFASALDRFEEAPIRLIDPIYHSSPLQEALSNPAIRKALEGVPGIAEKVIALIPGKGSAAVVVAPAAAAAAAAVAGSKSDPDSDV